MTNSMTGEGNIGGNKPLEREHKWWGRAGKKMQKGVVGGGQNAFTNLRHTFRSSSETKKAHKVVSPSIPEKRKVGWVGKSPKKTREMRQPGRKEKGQKRGIWGGYQ